MELDDFDENMLDQLIAVENESFQETSKLSQNNVPEPGPEHLKVLSQYFGHKKFRPMQWEIISAIIKEKRDVCAVMCTGYGKSLCFQYPSTFAGGITLVISPLISLMEDQILSLQVSNIPACLLGTAQRKQAQVITEIFDNVYSLVYLTPEFCTGEMGSDMLKRMSNELTVTLIAIDEAHCISSWGHDFRYQYRNLGFFHHVFPSVPIIAVTATATTKVRQDIINSLNLRNPLVICSGFNRPNFYFEIFPKGATGVFKDLTKVMTFEKTWKFSGPTIIYCITRKQTEEISQILQVSGINCRPYHAGLPLATRKETHEAFVKDKVDVVAATIAFGMGIDKPDIKNVIHYGSSRSIESYYQEVGRAGRDGLPARCVTFFNDSDFAILRALEERSRSNSKGRTEEHLKIMRNYLTTRNCRRRFILDHFEDKSLDHLTEPQTKCCDNCAKKLCDTRSDKEKYEGINDKGLYDFTADAKTLLKAVIALNSSFGLTIYTLFLRGSKAAKISERHQKNPLHGSGKNRSEDWWKALAKLLMSEGYLREETKKASKSFFTFTIVAITDKGKTLVNQIEKEQAQLLLPPTSDFLKLLKLKSGIDLQYSNNNNKPSTSTTVTIGDGKNESKADLGKRMDLYSKLLSVRSVLASASDIMPYMVASNAALMQMARLRPKTMDELRTSKLDGLTEAKIEKFGESFLKVVNENSEIQNQNQQKRTIKDILHQHPLPQATMNILQEVSCTFLLSGLTVGEIAMKRTLSSGTIVRHLVCGIKAGLPLKLINFGVIEQYRDIIVNNFYKLYKDFSDVRLKPIKEQCPPEITYDHIQAVVAYLEVRHHLETLAIPYEEFEDFLFSEVKRKCQDSDTDSKLDCLLSFGAEELKELENLSDALTQKWDDVIEPPCKKEKTDYSMILDSPPASVEAVVVNEDDQSVKASVSETIIDAPVKVAENNVKTSKKAQKLPPWLSTKKIN